MTVLKSTFDEEFEWERIEEGRYLTNIPGLVEGDKVTVFINPTLTGAVRIYQDEMGAVVITTAGDDNVLNNTAFELTVY